VIYITKCVTTQNASEFVCQPNYVRTRCGSFSALPGPLAGLREETWGKGTGKEKWKKCGKERKRGSVLRRLMPER